MSSEACWVRIGSVADVPEGSTQAAAIEDAYLAIHHLAGGEVCVTSDICAHEYARLSEGWLEGCVVVCPLHGARFDVRTGQTLGRPASKDLAVFETSLRGDEIWLKLDEHARQKMKDADGFR